MSEAADPSQAGTSRTPSIAPLRYSLTGMLMFLLLVAVGSAYVHTLLRLRQAESELADLRQETGYLAPSDEGEIAATRLSTDQAMSYRLRVRVPESTPYRVVYSSLWPASQTGPKWFGAIRVPPGESVVIVRIIKDPRDEKWKISAVCPGVGGTRRMATSLPPKHIEVFRGSHEWLRSGISQKTETQPVGQALRLLDERVLVGEGAMMLYGDRAPSGDMIGVFAELQPDVGTL